MPHRRLTERFEDEDLRVHRVTLLAWMFLVGSVLAVLAALIGDDPGSNRGLLLSAAAVGAVVTLGLWTRRHRRIDPRILQACLGLYSLIVAALALSADTLNGVTSLGPAVIMTCGYAGYFYRRRKLWVLMTLSVSSYTAAAVLATPETSWVALLTTNSTALAMGAVLHRLTALVRTRNLHDPLTGVLNRWTWMAIADDVLRRPRRGPLTVAILDLDNFKQINDRDGHLAGDQLLRELAGQWQDTLGGNGLVGRYGGDEFVILFVDTDPVRVTALLQLLTEAHPAAWSHGLATAGPTDDLAAVLDRADHALLRTKSHAPVDPPVPDPPVRALDLPTAVPAQRVDRPIWRNRLEAATRRPRTPSDDPFRADPSS